MKCIRIQICVFFMMIILIDVRAWIHVLQAFPFPAFPFRALPLRLPKLRFVLPPIPPPPLLPRWHLWKPKAPAPPAPRPITTELPTSIPTPYAIPLKPSPKQKRPTEWWKFD